MSTVHVDIAVIGTELCGLAAGASLAHAGHRVVVIDDEDHADLVPLGGLRAPVTPTLWRLPSGGPSVALLEKLGLRQDAKRALGAPEPLGLVDDPEIRMLLPLDEKERSAEFTRVFGDDLQSEKFDDVDYGAGISLLEEATQLHDDGFFARRREKKRVDEIAGGHDPAAPAIRKFCAGDEAAGLSAVLPHLAPFVVHDAVPDSKSISGLIALARLGRGTLGPCEDGLGPRPALRTLFLKVIAGHGGEVLEDAKVRSFSMSGKKVTTVQTSGKNDYAVQAVIDATRDRSLVDRLPSGKVREKAIVLRDTVRANPGGAVVRWLLPRRLLPRGIPNHLLLLPNGDAPAVVVGIFDARVTGAKSPGARSSEDAVSSENVFVLASARGAGADLSDRVEARLETLLPFAKAHTIARDRLDDALLKSVLPHYHCAEPAHQLGGRRPRDAASNWARAGRDLTPRFGIEGELASAKSVVALVEQMFGKKREA